MYLEKCTHTFKGNCNITGEPAGLAAVTRLTGKRYKEVIFKNHGPFTNCISEINDT